MKRAFFETSSGQLIETNSVSAVLGPFVDKHTTNNGITGRWTLYWEVHLGGSSARFNVHYQDFLGDWTAEQKASWTKASEELREELQRLRAAVKATATD